MILWRKGSKEESGLQDDRQEEDRQEDDGQKEERGEARADVSPR